MYSRTLPWLPMIAMMGLAALPRGSSASTNDRPAALLSYPYIVVDSSRGIDTRIQLSNGSPTAALAVACFYENYNRHCDNQSEMVCTRDTDCPPDGHCGAASLVTNFKIVLTQSQPLVWRLAAGRRNLPCDGETHACPSGDVNSGSVPPIPEDPFVGALLCYAVDANDHPIDRNDLQGEATIERYTQSPARLDVAQYSAVGLQARGSNNGDTTLILGGDAGAEYDGCANLNDVNHFFDGAPAPVVPDRRVFTKLVLLPCTRNPIAEGRSQTRVEYLVTNELDQRFMALGHVDGQLVSRLSEISAHAFESATMGSVAGVTTVRALDSGVFVVAIEEQEDANDPTQRSSAAVNVHYRGTRQRPDYLGMPPAVCGNFTVDPGEGCDDGNVVDGDCCSATCQVEAALSNCASDDNPCTMDHCDGHGTCLHPQALPLAPECGCCRIAAPSAACAGDCDGDGTVSPLERQSCVDLSQGKTSFTCTASCDANGDGTVDPTEVSLILDNERFGCVAAANLCLGPMVQARCEQDLSGTLVPALACPRNSEVAAQFDCPGLVLAPTATPSSTPVVSPPPTVTPTPILCAGDCDVSGDVTVDELLLMVNVALNLRPVSVCSPGDSSGDGEITVDEILAAVEAVLLGCG